MKTTTAMISVIMLQLRRTAVCGFTIIPTSSSYSAITKSKRYDRVSNPTVVSQCSMSTIVRAGRKSSSRLYTAEPTNDENISSIMKDEEEVVEDCDVVVFGGGFGGLYTALAIHNLQQQQKESSIQTSRRITIEKKKPNYKILLVEPSEQFVFLPLLYDLTVGTATEQEVCPTYNDILQGTNIRHVRASFESIDFSAATSTTDHRNIVATIRPVDGRISGTPTKLRMKAGIIAVGSTPNSMIDSVPGAKQLVQPFYTAHDAKQTRRLLNQLDEQIQQRMKNGNNIDNSYKRPRIAIIGGGYGGVELSASIKRRLPDAHVQLLSRGRPMANTRVEEFVDTALSKLGVIIEPCNVLAFTEADMNIHSNEGLTPKIYIKRSQWGTSSSNVDDEVELINEDELPWDAVLWTAGSTPADPVSNSGCDLLPKTRSGRIAIDNTLRCLPCSSNITTSSVSPNIWALGDCAEIITFSTDGKVLPKTAQVAMQQADVVAANVISQLLYDADDILSTSNNDLSQQTPEYKVFIYQDLGSMLTLGGPNAAVMAPKDDTMFGPIFAPLLDVADTAFSITDKVFSSIGNNQIAEQFGVPTLESYGLSLSSYGLGGTTTTNTTKGILAGTIAGAARRAVYAIRMPTNQQRAVSLLSATISTAAALLKESTDRRK